MLNINQFNKIIAANWKLNGSKDFIDSYFNHFEASELNSDVCAVICPPAIYFQHILDKLPNLFYMGGQNCSNYNKGAYTGEMSAQMLNEFNCQFCIVGHSERRQKFKEKNQDILEKAEKLIDCGINPIICVGETIDQKNKKITKEVLFDQVLNSIPKNADSSSVIIAYEPIWAIGSGITPNLDEIAKIHDFIKNEIDNFTNFKVIYGGSVKSNNSSEIMNLSGVDGLLVGGSSLDPKEFSKIVQS